MDKAETRMAIRRAVLEAMETSDIPNISIVSICKTVGISRSTFYRYYDSIDDVIKKTGDELIASLKRVSRFDAFERPLGFGNGFFAMRQSDVVRAEILYEAAPFIRAVTGIHGDPSFTFKAVALIRENILAVYGDRLKRLPNHDFFLEFVMAGLFNVISYWLRERLDLSPEEIVKVQTELFESVNKMMGVNSVLPPI